MALNFLPASVVIVNHNAGPLLAECVQAALRDAAQVVVVDNASADGSVEQLERRCAGEPRLLVLREPANLGFAAGCNRGYNRATQTRLLFLNPDCLIAAGAMQHLLQVLEHDPAAGMVGGLLVNPDGTEQGGGRRAVPTPWRSFVRAFGLTRLSRRWPGLFFDFHLHQQPLPAQPIEVEAISGACMLVRREALEAAGLWDEGYFLHCEDLDLCMAVRRLGWKILFDPGARLVHHKGACSRARPVFVEWHKHRGMLRFYRKHFSRQYTGPLMWLVALAVWLRFAAVAALRTLQRLGRKHG